VPPSLRPLNWCHPLFVLAGILGSPRGLGSDLNRCRPSFVLAVLFWDGHVDWVALSIAAPSIRATHLSCHLVVLGGGW
jgi:hypothetical protein